ncbi:MAG: flagellar biosynthetic protein FliQ [Pseudomonadota bacterium]
MTDAIILDMLREALWTALQMSWPILGAALLLGLLVGILQALTSIQEMTLTFVPKIAAMAAVFWISMEVMGEAIVSLFRDQIIPIIAGG